MSHFAETVKARRQELNMTMQALADKASVSKSMVCKIERDEVQPTLDVAARIARALGKTLSEMLHSPQAAAVVFLPKDQQATWEDSNRIKRRNISPVFEGLKLEWLHVEIPAHTALDKCVSTCGQDVAKYLLIVAGQLEVHVGQQSFIMQTGDSIYFDGNLGHQYINCSDTPAEAYMLVQH